MSRSAWQPPPLPSRFSCFVTFLSTRPRLTPPHLTSRRRFRRVRPGAKVGEELKPRELTVAASPMLATKRRSVRRSNSVGGAGAGGPAVLSTEEAELEKAKANKFRARPMPDYSKLAQVCGVLGDGECWMYNVYTELNSQPDCLAQRVCCVSNGEKSNNGRVCMFRVVDACAFLLRGSPHLFLSRLPCLIPYV